MKKTLFFLFVALQFSIGHARPVDASTARRVAECYLAAMGMKNTASLSDVTATTPFSEFYLFASEEGGFILVSADDCVTPILGYSISSRFSAKEMPAHVRSFLEGYEREIRFYKELEAQGAAPSAQLQEQWRMLASGAMPPAPLTTAVDALLSTTWNQRPYYNLLCPYDENETGNHHIVTGCVATATAQIMKYHTHPATGYGSHSYTHSTYGTLSANFGNTTYQWAQMPAALTSASTDEQVNAVATLMYHIGVADEMNYGLASAGGSGAFNYNTSGQLGASSQTALMKHFKYRPDMAAVARDNYSDSLYCAILRAELDQSRPILYSGFGGGGHSFVLDGYNNDGLFHVNWGWGGNHDGFFAMGALNPSGSGVGGNLSGTYNLDNTALIGIRPNPQWNTATTITTSVEGCSAATVSGAGTYAFGDVATLSVAVPEGYRFDRWNDYDRFNSRQLYANGGTYAFTAYVEPVAGNIRSYCGDHCNAITSYSYPTWGIRLPASVLSTGDTLKAVQLFIPTAGTYTLTVYTGTNAPTTAVYTASRIFTSYDEEQWRTFLLATPLPVDGSQNLWLTFFFNGSGFPAAVTSSSGNPDGFLVGDNMSTASVYNHYSAMIRGLFGNTSGLVDSTDVVDCSQAATTPYRLDFGSAEFSRQINCWTFLDADGDANNWYVENSYFTSRSWRTEALTPDNWLISPAITLPAGSTYLLSCKDAADNISWPAEHYGIFVSTTGTEPADFTLLQGYTLSDTNWTTRTVDLSAYAGQTIHIAFRHYNCTNQFSMHLKDISLDAIAALPYTTGFESGEDAAWELVNGSNAWTVGSAVAANGSNSLYITNDNGTSHAYTNTSSSTSFASRKFDLAVGEYAFSFDWMCQGEGNYDFIRVWAVPSDAELIANEFPTIAPIYTNTPEGWIDLVDGKLNANSTWSTASGTFFVTTPGIYKLVFCWTNDGSMGSNPPAAIDNVSLTALSCPSPTNLAVNDVSATSITFSWDANGSSQWLVSLDNGSWQPVSTNSFTASGLAVASQHTLSVRTLCGNGDSSLVVSLSAATTCQALTAPYSEDFEGLSELPLCWSTEGTGNWTVGTGDYSTNTGAASGTQNLKITHSSTDNVTYLISPLFDLASFDSARLTFQHVQRSWSGDIDELAVLYRTATSAPWQTLATFTAAVPTWTAENLVMTSLSATCQVAFVCTDHYGYGIGIDNITIEGIGASQPTNLTLTANANDATMGTATGSGTYPSGTMVTATAIPFAGYAFLGWSNGTPDNPYSFPLNANTSLSATFTPMTGGTVVDTQYIYINDTLWLTDTVWSIQIDTLYQQVHDTVTNTEYIHDTVTHTEYVYDTVTNTEYVYDTTLVTDTVWLTVHDTLYLTEYIHDTIYIYDTVYVGIGDVETIAVRLYQRDGQIVVEGTEGQPVAFYDAVGRIIHAIRQSDNQVIFDVPASGVYLVKVGDAPARRIVVIK